MIYKSVEKLKAYFQGISEKSYQETMQRAKKDVQFERMVQDMTLGRITGKSSFDKLKRF